MDKSDFLIECLEQDLVKLIMLNDGVSLKEAINKYYNSNTSKFIRDTETGYYTQSSDYMYEVYKEKK